MTRDEATGDRDSYVITEDHYIDYMLNTEVTALLPIPLPEKLKRSHYLFLGYGLKDWNLALVVGSGRTGPSTGSRGRSSATATRSTAVLEEAERRHRQRRPPGLHRRSEPLPGESAARRGRGMSGRHSPNAPSRG